ncbi:uncharacterized protein TNCV_4986651 [Trichonephila clavipes]|nr:uncharacterized protein TNCV_4986651 [Trichonephila clavipes]
MLDDIPADDQSSVNIVIDLNIISELLKSMARCKYCNKCDSLITEDTRSRRGLCVSLILRCTFCGQAFTSMSSNSTNRVYDVNVRLAYGLRCIGKGSSAANTFCAVMNLPPPPTKFQRYYGILLEMVSKVSDASMKKAVEETVEMKNNNRDITAAFDGSWQKRGHTSLNGVISATSLETGHGDSPRQDKIICSMQTLPRSSTHAQSHLEIPNRRKNVTKNGNGPSEGLFAEILYSPDAPRIAAVIKTLDGN